MLTPLNFVKDVFCRRFYHTKFMGGGKFVSTGDGLRTRGLHKIKISPPPPIKAAEKDAF